MDLNLEQLKCLVWMIPLLPFAGFLVNGFVGRHLPKVVVWAIACLTVAGSFVIALGSFLYLRKTGDASFASHPATWINVGMVDAQYKLVVDHLSSIMILVITGVGLLIHFYSFGYMADEKRFARYFAYLNLFTGFMLILVLASNLFLMFVGWEGVGLCSYLLIGFWFEEEANAKAGKKAFIVNRVGDLSFTIGVLLIIAHVGTIEVSGIKAALAENPELLGGGLATLVGLLLFGGATGKSAQLPLYVWLPDAMAGPTPVSALIHAATMVTAGVYMVARMDFLYVLAPTALAIVAFVGCVTAVFAGSIAMVQNDIKKVLAYSTVSQLGFMFMGVGSGFFFAGVFHLMTHAFFKACLFLGSGSVILGMHHEQDIRKMGGLMWKMPITAITFIVASLALAGLPFVTAGFWSKEAVLGAVWQSGPIMQTFGKSGAQAMAMAGFFAAGLTAFYMTRIVLKTFFGKAHWKEAHGDDHGHGHHEPHESPFTMWLPLVILMGLSIGGGFLGADHWLASEETVHHAHGPTWFIGASFVVSIGGILLGLFFFGIRKDLPEKMAKGWAGLYQFLLHKYYVDEIYEATVIKGQIEANNLAGRFDNAVIDGAVNGAAGTTASVSGSSGVFDNEVVDGGVNLAGSTTRLLGTWFRQIQTGNVKHYLTGAVVGGLFIVAAVCAYFSRAGIMDVLEKIGLRN